MRVMKGKVHTTQSVPVLHDESHPSVPGLLTPLSNQADKGASDGGGMLSSRRGEPCSTQVSTSLSRDYCPARPLLLSAETL